MHFERLATLPLDAAIKVGEGVIWLTEQFVPPNPPKPEIGANITIFEAPPEEPPDQAA
jgi:hypothetical protein